MNHKFARLTWLRQWKTYPSWARCNN